MTHEPQEPIDLFGDGVSDDPVVVERAAPTYEGTTHSPESSSEPEPIEIDATNSAYAGLPERLQGFVDGLVRNEDPRSLARRIGLAPSLAGVLLRRTDIQDALRECLQVTYGTRIMGELEQQAHLSEIVRDQASRPGDRIRAIAELANIQGIKDRTVRAARERLTKAVEVVVTREEGAAGTLTREEVAAMEGDALGGGPDA